VMPADGRADEDVQVARPGELRVRGGVEGHRRPDP
jgi:hypothetical protein